MNFGGRPRALLLTLSAVLWTLSAMADDGGDHQVTHGQPSSDFEVFVSGEAHHFTAPESGSELNEDANLIGDAVLAVNRDRFRLFGEFQLSNQEHDLERFQVGFEPVPDTVIWLGRFHQPASAWNTEHHHGRYLQTAITRPSIELWEDEGGLIPQHITGLYIDSRRAVGDGGGLHLATGAGLGTVIQSSGLSEYDLLDPHTTGRRLSLSARVAYLPDYVGTSEFGLLFAHNNMTVLNSTTARLLHATKVEQSLYGGFVNLNSAPWRLQFAIYALRMDLSEMGADKNEDMEAGYLQVERQLPKQFTVYAREENSSRAAQSTFVVVNHPYFELRRATVGLRWDFWRHQALTAEAAHGQTIGAHEYEYRLQWSAAIP